MDNKNKQFKTSQEYLNKKVYPILHVALDQVI